MSRIETPEELAGRLFGHPDKQVVAEEAIRARDEQIRAALLEEAAEQRRLGDAAARPHGLVRHSATAAVLSDFAERLAAHE